jgi:stage V sporulation protein AB
MWIKQIFLGVIGLTSGFTVAGGAFAFITALSIIPRIVAKTHTARKLLFYENLIFFGALLGNILTIFFIKLPLGPVFLVLYGVATGIYTGCTLMALAEVLNTFPILFRRSNLKMGMGIIVIAIAIGKLAGSILYYLKDMSS